jgi:hypothetical protein
VLEEAGIIGDVNIAEFPLYFLPLEQDILSLELDDAFGDLYLVGLGLPRGSGRSCIDPPLRTRIRDASSMPPKL